MRANTQPRAKYKFLACLIAEFFDNFDNHQKCSSELFNKIIEATNESIVRRARRYGLQFKQEDEQVEDTITAFYEKLCDPSSDMVRGFRQIRLQYKNNFEAPANSYLQKCIFTLLKKNAPSERQEGMLFLEAVKKKLRQLADEKQIYCVDKKLYSASAAPLNDKKPLAPIKLPFQRILNEHRCKYKYLSKSILKLLNHTDNNKYGYEPNEVAKAIFQPQVRVDHYIVTGEKEKNLLEEKEDENSINPADAAVQAAMQKSAVIFIPKGLSPKQSQVKKEEFLAGLAQIALNDPGYFKKDDFINGHYNVLFGSKLDNTEKIKNFVNEVMFSSFYKGESKKIGRTTANYRWQSFKDYLYSKFSEIVDIDQAAFVRQIVKELLRFYKNIAKEQKK